ncbi:MAG: MFS transporter [bacterium]
MAAYPYSRLSAYYFFYFAALGVFVPFWPVYLHDDLQFSAVQVGQLLAIFMLSKIVAPFVWGWLVDHFGYRLRLIRWASLLTVICFLGVYWQQSFAWFAVVMLLFGFFWNAALPQFEALTLNHLGKSPQRYAMIRLWGSIGFIVSAAGLPFYLASDFSAESLAGIPLFMLLGLLVLWWVTYLVQDKDHHHEVVVQHNLWQQLKRPMILALLLACALQQASHGVYYTFFSLYLEDHQYSKVFIGWMWALGVIAEVFLFLVMHRLMQRFGACRLFVLAMLLTAIRWFMLAWWVDNIALLSLAQLLHAATYGLFHAAAIHLIHELFPGKLQGRGQALYAGVSFGVGGALGSLLSGYAWESLGAEQTFFCAAVLMLVTWLFAAFFIHHANKGHHHAA